MIESNKHNVQEGKYDLSSFIPSSSRGIEKATTRNGVMSIIYAKTGKRVNIDKKLLNTIGCESTVKFSFNDNLVAIAKELPNNNNCFNIKLGKSRGNIYSSDLVKELIKKYSLDFTNRTSITFNDVEYVDVEGIKVAIVKVINNGEANEEQ
ncbi:MAG: hypothetical protein ACLUDK_14235 [Clostridium paraputrificum]